MKKLILAALISLSLTSMSFAADENTVDRKVQNNFRYDFSDARDVKWTKGKFYITASFVHDQKGTEAYYDFNGNLIGTAYAVTVEHLPLSAKRVLAKKYAGYTIKEIISFEKSEEDCYFVSLSSSSETVILQVLDGQVSLYKKLD